MSSDCELYKDMDRKAQRDICFTRLRAEHLEMVMRWRSSPDINKWMATDVVYDMDRQRAWFNCITEDSSYRYWVVYYQDIPVGLINLANIDYVNKHCDWGFYIGEKSCRGKGVGSSVPPYLYNHVFRVMGFRKIYCDVIYGNNILKMHEAHGYREVGVHIDHYLKDGLFLDTVLIELLSESWLCQERYSGAIAEFP